ncbi:transcription termination factor MTERF4, chloroplastic isoform X2 [Pyrus x bretschneideri]|uniref:transcription termination factor MTERF4, chloroplastic isoform X2 n=1 Tax=Pyrus x bretschneideri TaxID=225117 RepID=UPI00202FA590|nr:transcription termination factor MTERF4, chloroplastic isoform X2 [Pyrus x bretschneideri]
MVGSLLRARNSITKIPKVFSPNPQILTPNSTPIQSHQNPCPQLPHPQNPSRVLQNSFFSTQSSKFPEYEMPSVTWGVVQGRKEKLVSRVIICDYLKSLGIIPDELENLELPSAVDVMRERVEFLQKLGLSIDDINEYPLMLGCSVRKNMIPVLAYLEKIGIPRPKLGLPKKILARMLEKRTYLLGYDLEETVKPNVDCLISFGIRREALASVVAQYPQILGLPLKAKMSSQQYFFSLKLKIDPEGFARVVEKMPQIVSLHQHLIMKPVEFLLGRGIASEDVAKMVVKCPQLIALRVELMKNSFYFFKSEMGRPLKELVDFPEYFTYSLESRIKPRYQRLQSKGIRCSLKWFLNCSDQRFEERLQGEYIETETPGPSFYMGGKLELPGSEMVSDEDDESDDEVLYRRTVSL